MGSSDVLRPDAQVHFGVFFQGVNHTTIWSDPASGSQIDFETFRHVVTTAERGLFDAFFLGEGLRLREQDGKILELDIAGRPDAIAQLSALAGITERIGLVATQNTTYNEPGDLARRLAGLDILSGGRAGWNAVTTDNAWTGENFRRGGFLDHALRYERAGQFIRTARAIWDSWADDAIASSTAGEFWSDPNAVRHRRPFDVAVRHLARRRRCRAAPRDIRSFSRPGIRRRAEISPRPMPMSSSPRHGTHFDDALAFANDIRARLLAAGRPADDIRILPGTQIVLAEKASEVEEKRRWVLEGQYTGQTALSLVGLVWGRDLSDRDPDGPLPEFDPVPAPISATRGAARDGKDPIAIAKEWRALAEAKNLSLRQVAIETSAALRLCGHAGAGRRRAGPLGTCRRDRRLQHLAVHRARRTRRDRRLAGARTTGTRGVPDRVHVDDVARPSRAA